MSFLICGDSFCLLHLKRQSHTNFLRLSICRVDLLICCPLVCIVFLSPLPSGHFHDILLIFSFWQFNDDMSKCISLFIYLILDWLLLFLDMYIDVFLQIWAVFSPISSNIYIYIYCIAPFTLFSLRDSNRVYYRLYYPR